MDGQLISWSMKDSADALALSRSDFHVKNATMVTMIGRATQSTMRLMGSFTWHIAVTEGFRLSSSLFWNKKADLKSRNTALLFSVVFTRHLHLLLLSSFWSFVTRVMLQRVWLVRLYLHRGETDRETSHSCRSSPGSVHLNISAFSFGLRQEFHLTYIFFYNVKYKFIILVVFFIQSLSHILILCILLCVCVCIRTSSI